jgi:hypothetical protein
VLDNGWLLLLYSLPAGRSSARVSLWRRLQKSGALPLKTSAYLLPNRPDLLEKFQWLVQQVRHEGGEATLAHVSDVEGLTEEEIIRQFHDLRANDYAEVSAALKNLIARQRRTKDVTWQAELEKLRRQFEEIRRVDFLHCPQGEAAATILQRASSLPAKQRNSKPAVLSPHRFTGKTWLTRPRPEIDRVGSAWLIRSFIDAKATFVFGNDLAAHADAIPYDMMGVEFTHHGEDCTFETLLKRFDLKDKALRRLGEMIHDADLEDGKFQAIEAMGLDRVLKGWGRLGLKDAEILQRGFQCFDALYQFLKSQR